MMNDVLAQLTLEQKLDLLDKLLPHVISTCGRHNCNCVGSNVIKQLLDQAGLSPTQHGSRR
jgi:hypothetical protein